jgi:hypothetical protein
VNGAVPDSTCSNAITYTPGNPIPITASATIRARAIKAGMDPSDVLVANYVETDPGRVATPVANPPGTTFVTPLSVSLSTATPGANICYTLDGTDPDSTCSNATPYTGTPIVLSASTTLKARAVKSDMYPSGILTENYTFLPPINIVKAWYLDQNGDGRIDHATLDFDKPLPQTPDSLSFQITGHAGRGVNVTATRAQGEIASSQARVTVTFRTPLDFGITSVLNAPSSGRRHRQDNIPLSAGTFAVDDSVPPVLFEGEVFEPDDTHPLKRVLLTYSEPVDFPAASQQEVIFKRATAETPFAQVRIDHINKLSELQYEFHIDSTSAFFPIKGDSAAISVGGQTRDLLGNAPASKHFQVLGGTVPPAKPVKIYITFPSGTMDPNIPGVTPSSSDIAVFIPVLPDGNPIPGSGEGKCGSCYAGDGRVFVGPVVHLEVPGPLEYKFQIFTNLGEFVASGSGRITPNDLALLEQVDGGSKYRYRAVWTGKTDKGQRAATGAYLLMAQLKVAQDPKTGAPPYNQTRRVLFGNIRNTGTGSL